MYLQLPPCDTDIFHGGYEEWQSFRDMFTAVYINHPQLSPSQKLYHLRYKTRGQAGQIVKQFPLSDDNFDLAWQALSERYENKRILVDNQIQILLNLPSIHVEDSEKIINLQSKIKTCLSILNTQKVLTDSWDPILIHICVSKLPNYTRLLWEQSLPSRRDLPLWSQMDEFLTSRFQVLERVEMKFPKSVCRTSNLPESHNGAKTFKTSSKLVFSCYLCSTPHPMKKCQVFKKFSIEKRLKFIKANKLCRNCLAFNHSLAECKSPFACMYCQKRHNSLLHVHSSKGHSKKGIQQNINKPITPDRQINGSCRHTQKTTVSQYKAHPTNGKTQRAIAQHSTAHAITKNRPKALTSSKSDEHPTCSNSAHVNSLQNASENEVLLPTAIVTIEHGGEQFQLRALLDQGSQKTFISSAVQKRLKLPTEHSQFELFHIGGCNLKHTKNVCKLKITTRKSKRSINTKAVMLNQLTELLPTSPISRECIKQFNTQELADPSFSNPSPIDLVIGSDILPQILLDGAQTFKNNIMAQNTIFGWVLSGPAAKYFQ